MKTIVITGSTDGLGLEVAARLAEAGHRVALHGRSEQKLDAAKAKLNNPNVETWRADLSDPLAALALGQQLAAHYPQIDVLINNAGCSKSHRSPPPRKSTCALWLTPSHRGC